MPRHEPLGFQCSVRLRRNALDFANSIYYYSNPDTEQATNNAGFRFFPDIEPFKGYVRREILAIEEELPVSLGVNLPQPTIYTCQYLIERYPSYWEWVYHLAKHGDMSLGVRMGQGSENEALATAIIEDTRMMAELAAQDISFEDQLREKKQKIIRLDSLK